jgi:transposase
MPELLRLSRWTIDALGRMNKQLLEALRTDQTLAARVQRLMTIPGVGPVLSLTWALEMGDIARFPSVKDVISYCG